MLCFWFEPRNSAENSAINSSERPSRFKPLAVNARVIRDDGERGLVLAFHDLDASAESYLHRLAAFLPILAVRDEAGTAAGVVVSEILEHHSEPQVARA